MYRSFIFKVLLTTVLVMALLPVVQAHKNSPKYQLQDKEKDLSKKKPDQKPNIKEVPKARKQPRPIIVVKPTIKVNKVKPIKIIRLNLKKL